jgi:hypothetical protein
MLRAYTKKTTKSSKYAQFRDLPPSQQAHEVQELRPS